jgi:hypothetical protein
MKWTRLAATREGDGVDIDVAGEPVGGSFGGVDGAASDLHSSFL